ncbi:MAG: hypothetical protein K0S86_3935, partial [Geminicoccaceae bacterium]|nr:hypothetical protein [Geminicoccaceae bacterium]
EVLSAGFSAFAVAASATSRPMAQ